MEELFRKNGRPEFRSLLLHWYFKHRPVVSHMFSDCRGLYLKYNLPNCSSLSKEKLCVPNCCMRFVAANYWQRYFITFESPLYFLLDSFSLLASAMPFLCAWQALHKQNSSLKRSQWDSNASLLLTVYVFFFMCKCICILWWLANKLTKAQNAAAWHLLDVRCFPCNACFKKNLCNISYAVASTPEYHDKYNPF